MEHFSVSAHISWNRSQFQLLPEIYINCFQAINMYFPLPLTQVHGFALLQEGITFLIALAKR